MDMGSMHPTASGFAALSLWGAFLLGLTGGFGHCLAMCGPFVAAAGLTDGAACGARASAASGRRTAAGAGAAARFQLAYHLGRLATYTLLGALLGLLGEAGAVVTLTGPLSPTALTRWLKLGAGALMLAVGVIMLVAWMRGRSARLPEPTAWVAGLPWFGRTVARLARSGGWWGLPLGALMGLLPCAPLLPAELAALATGNPLFGAATMLAFGLGTLPALGGFGALSGLLGVKARGRLAPVTALLVAALGLLTLWQGLASAGVLS